MGIRLYPPTNFKLQKNKLYVICGTSKLLSEEVINFINVGVQTTFTYYIILYEKKLFFDTQIKRVVVNKRVEYDIWSEIYSIKIDYPRSKTLYFKKLDSLNLAVSSGIILYEIFKNI